LPSSNHVTSMLQETEPNPSTLGSSHQTATYANLRLFVRVVLEKAHLQSQLENSPKKFGASTSAALGLSCLAATNPFSAGKT